VSARAQQQQKSEKKVQWKEEVKDDTKAGGGRRNSRRESIQEFRQARTTSVMTEFDEDTGEAYLWLENDSTGAVIAQIRDYRAFSTAVPQQPSNWYGHMILICDSPGATRPAVGEGVR